MMNILLEKIVYENKIESEKKKTKKTKSQDKLISKVKILHLLLTAAVFIIKGFAESLHLMLTYENTLTGTEKQTHKFQL